MINISFNKELDNSGKWYAVVPEWTGDKADLQMVCGADTLLDMINMSLGEPNTINLDIYVDDEFSIDIFEGSFKLIKEGGDEGGGWYIGRYKDQVVPELWLCEVLRFIFNKIPIKINYIVQNK